MRNFLDRMTFNVPDGGSGGGAPAPAAAAAPPAISPPAAGTPPAAAAAPPAPSAGDPPAGAGGPPAGGEFYKPQGLAEHLLGKDQNETMDKMAKALDGYRARDAQNGVPDRPEAYGEFSGEIPDTIKPHLETLKGDPLFGRVAAKALEHKISVPAYQALTQEFLSVSAEMGLMEPIVDEKAERAALVPDVAKHLTPAEQQQAVEKRINDNYAFLDGLIAKDIGIDKDVAEYAKAMIGDSAKGHRLFEAMQKMTGGQAGTGPSFGNTPPGGLDPKQEIARRQALPENTWGDAKFNQQSYDQLQADLRRVYGE